MGMTFSLKNANGSATLRLKPWGIYEVTFKGIETATGESKEGKTWKAIKIKFASDEGIFEPMLFCPGEKGDERPSGQTGDRKWTMPSQLENFMYNIAHIGDKLGEKALWEKMQGLTYDLPSDFDKIVANLQQVVKKAVGKPTHIKLVGDSKNYASIPNIVNLSKEGQAYVSNNWIGDGLAFDDYEIKRKNKQQNAKPTEVDATTEKEVDATEENSDLNYEL